MLNLDVLGGGGGSTHKLNSLSGKHSWKSTDATLDLIYFS